MVGKEGWMVEQLAARLKEHPEKGKRLFWLAGISDEMLLKLYAGASALLAPSEGEGFGLPLIEAAQHDIPIIARSIPVFREVAGEHAYYFDGLQADDLARAVTDWLALWREGKAPTSSGMPWLTWDQSARQLTDAVVEGRWYRSVPGQRA
jgi:glycosyltransferase involved in cell wall biosynthesis